MAQSTVVFVEPYVAAAIIDHVMRVEAHIARTAEDEVKARRDAIREELLEEARANHPPQRGYDKEREKNIQQEVVERMRDDSVLEELEKVMEEARNDAERQFPIVGWLLGEAYTADTGNAVVANKPKNSNGADAEVPRYVVRNILPTTNRDTLQEFRRISPRDASIIGHYSLAGVGDSLQTVSLDLMRDRKVPQLLHLDVALLTDGSTTVKQPIHAVEHRNEGAPQALRVRVSSFKAFESMSLTEDANDIAAGHIAAMLRAAGPGGAASVVTDVLAAEPRLKAGVQPVTAARDTLRAAHDVMTRISTKGAAAEREAMQAAMEHLREAQRHARDDTMMDGLLLKYTALALVSKVVEVKRQTDRGGGDEKGRKGTRGGAATS